MSPELVIFDGALWLAVLVAVLAGLISFVSPCVLPLVPGYLGYLGSTSGDARGSRPRLLLGVLLFIAGFTVVFMTVTVLGGTLGRFFLEYANALTRVLGVLVIALGLIFVGLFPRAQRTLRLQPTARTGLWTAPLLGIALGIGWTPCIGPTLAAIMSISWNLGDPGRAAVLGIAYSLGLGLPFLLVALGLGWATRSVEVLRRHIHIVNIVGGTTLILLGVLMVTGVWGRLMSLLQGVMLSVTLPL